MSSARRRCARIVVTHYHPDHNGATAALMEVTGAPEFVQGRRDHELTYAAFLDPDGPARFESYLVTLGMPAEEAVTSATDERETPYHPATPNVLVDEGDVLELQGEEFGVFHLPGHADGHVVFVGATSGRMFGGDVILNEITPNVGLWDEGETQTRSPSTRGRSTASNTSSGRRSCTRVTGRRSPTPGPGPARSATTTSCASTRASRRGERRRDAVRGRPQHLWGGRLGYHERRFAMVEAAAHLVRLVGLGRAREVTPFRFAVV